MRLLTWNCAGSYRTKAAQVAPYEPDIAVIQECETTARLREGGMDVPADAVWVGDLWYKGLGVFPGPGITLGLDPDYDQDIRYCLPLRVRGRLHVNLLAVWTMDDRERGSRYIDQLRRAVQRYRAFLQECDAVVMGDWNSNAMWDRRPDHAPHGEVVALLADLGLVSAYHAHRGEAHGAETEATFHLYRHADKPSHIDYCCVPAQWMPRLTTLTIGDYEPWCQHSDHRPMIVEIAPMPGDVR